MLKKIALFVILAAIAFQLLINEPVEIPINRNVPQTEIKDIGVALDDQGRLIHKGWMKNSHKVLNDDKINRLLKWFRFKKWDCYDLFTEEYIMQFCIIDLSYSAKAQVTIYDKNTRKTFNYEKMLLPFQTPELSSTSYRFMNGTIDDIILNTNSIELQIRSDPANVKSKEYYFLKYISLNIPSEGVNLNLTLNGTRKHEMIAMLSSLNEDASYFYYNLKSPNYPVKGTVSFGGKTSELTYRNALGGLDWGRGIFPYHTFWIYVRGQGRLESGERFAINLGHGFEHPEASKATEDAYFVNDNVHKLNAAIATYDKDNLMNPWNFHCIRNNKNFKECEITFRPQHQLTKAINLLVIKSKLNVVFGTLEGWVSDTNNEKIHFKDLDCYVEEHFARWQGYNKLGVI